MLEAMNHRYKKQILKKLLIGFSAHDYFLAFIKSLTIKNYAVYLMKFHHSHWDVPQT